MDTRPLLLTIAGLLVALIGTVIVVHILENDQRRNECHVRQMETLLDEKARDSVTTHSCA
jgi:hypothetical protein